MVQKFDPEQPALAVEVQDDVSDGLHGTLDDALADRVASPDVGQVQIPRVNLGIPSQTEGHLLVTLTRRLRRAGARPWCPAPPHSRRLPVGVALSHTDVPASARARTTVIGSP